MPFEYLNFPQKKIFKIAEIWPKSPFLQKFRSLLRTRQERAHNSDISHFEI